MNFLTNDWFFIMVFNSVTGLGAHFIWKAISRIMDKRGQYELIKYMGMLVISLYLIPVVYLRYVKKVTDMGEYQPALMKTISVCKWGSISDVTPTVFLVMECLFAIWLTGACIQLVKYLKNRAALRAFLNDSLAADKKIEIMKEQIAGELELKTKINVFIHYSSNVPFVTGVKHPAVYIPDSDYTEQELKVILYHEIVHVRHRALAVKKIIMWMKIIYWFNPFIYKLEKDMDSIEETCCDEQVCRAKHVIGSYKDYFRIILDSAERGLCNPAFMMGLKGDAGELKKRMVRMSHYKSVTKIRRVWAVVFAVVFIAGSSVSAAAMGSVIEQGYICALNATDEKAVEISLMDEEKISAVCETPKENCLAENSIFGIDTCGELSEGALVVPANTRIEINTVYVKNRNEVFMCAFQDSDNGDLGVGLISSDGVRYEKKNSYPYTYEFTINRTGMYKIYVENYSSESVKVDFNYVMLDIFK